MAVCLARPWQSALCRRKGEKKTASVFSGIGSLLCPFALSISFSEKAAGAARGKGRRDALWTKKETLDFSRVLVEHSGFEPLTSTMRMSRATNCANAPNCVFFQRSIILAQTAEKSKGKRKFFCAAGVMPAAGASRTRGNGTAIIAATKSAAMQCATPQPLGPGRGAVATKKRGHATHSRARTVKKAPIRTAGCNEGLQALHFSSYRPALPVGRGDFSEQSAEKSFPQPCHAG